MKLGGNPTYSFPDNMLGQQTNDAPAPAFAEGKSLFLAWEGVGAYSAIQECNRMVRIWVMRRVLLVLLVVSLFCLTSGSRGLSHYLGAHLFGQDIGYAAAQPLGGGECLCPRIRSIWAYFIL